MNLSFIKLESRRKSKQPVTFSNLITRFSTMSAKRLIHLIVILFTDCCNRDSLIAALNHKVVIITFYVESKKPSSAALLAKLTKILCL